MAADLTAPARPSCEVRTACAGCGSGDLRVFLDLESSPLADRFPLPGESEDWYPLRVASCGRCRLVQLLDVVPDGELFGGDYGFRTGSSPALAAHYERWAKQLLAEHGDLARWGVAEIGCNDGTLLSHFRAAGCPTLGIDPSSAVHDAAAAGIEVRAEPFTAALAAQTYPAGLVIACNVAAHVAEPHDFLAGIRTLLRPGGLAIIEFQYLGDLLAGCMLDHVYHEHRFFYSYETFSALARQADMHPCAVERTTGQGGSLRVTLAAGPDGNLELDGDDALCSPHIFTGMQARADYAAARLRNQLAVEGQQDRLVAGYGAPAKATTLLNFAGIDAGLLPFAEDLTPGKIGRCIPGTHIPIVKPGERGRADTYLLLAWNYLSQALHNELLFMTLGGRFIVPGPVPVVI